MHSRFLSLDPFDDPLSLPQKKKKKTTAALASSPGASRAIVSIPDPDSLAPFTARDFERVSRVSGDQEATTMVDAFEFVVPLRVVAPRGAVPADWASDFRSLLGRRGALAFEARAQVADIVTELSSPEKGWEEEGGMAKKKRKALKNRRHRSAATADAVCLSDQWLGPAVSRGLLQPIPGAEEQRWWVSLFGGERIERDGWGMERREERRGAQWNERLTPTHQKKKKKKKKKSATSPLAGAPSASATPPRAAGCPSTTLGERSSPRPSAGDARSWPFAGAGSVRAGTEGGR